MKTCRCCGRQKPLKDFPLYGHTGSDGLRHSDSRCRECKAAYRREWRIKNRDRVNRMNREYGKANPRRMKRCYKKWRENNRFGIALKGSRINAKKHGYLPCSATVEELKNAFAGRCHICGEVEGADRLHMDHDHETGKFRGWLCSSCNHGLGRFRDSQELLTKALEYLRK